MARLTWDSVSVPNFGNAVDGIAAANQMLNQGFNAARGGLREVEENKIAAMSNQAMLDVLKYQDPEALKTAMATGEYQNQYGGKNARYLNKDAIAALSGRADDLLKTESSRVRLSEDQITLGQNKVKDRDFQFFNSEENRPIVNALRQARNAGRVDLEQQILAANPEFAKMANPDALNAIITGGQSIYGTDTDRFNADEDRAVSQAAEVEKAKLIQLAGGPEYVEAFLNTNPEYLSKYGTLADRVYAKLLGGGNANAGAGGVNAALGSVAGGGGYGPAVATDFSKFSTDENAAALTAGAKELGINPEDLAVLMSYETGGTYDPSKRGGKNNAHIGLIQFGANEQKTYGAAQGQTFAQQMPAVIRYLKDRGVRPGDDLLQLYSIVNTGGRDRFNLSDNGGKDTVRSHVDRMRREHTNKARAFLRMAQGGGSGGVVPTAYESPIVSPKDTEFVTRMANQHKLSTDKLLRMAVTFDQKWNSTASADDVAKQLVGKGGAFEGQNASYISKYLRDTADELGYDNYGILGEILEEAKGDEKGVIGKFANNFWGSSGLDHDINDDRLKELVNFAKDRNAVTRLAKSVNDTSTAMANSQQLTGQAAAIRSAWEQARANAQLNGRSTEYIDRAFQSQLNALEPKRDAALVNSVRSGTQGVAQDTNPVGTNKTRNGGGAPQRDTTTARDAGNADRVFGNLPVAQQAKAKAQGITRLTGAIREREEAKFRDTYGVDSKTALQSPSKIPAVVNAMRDRIKTEARQALAKGPAGIAWFEARYGKHPSRYY